MRVFDILVVINVPLRFVRLLHKWDLAYHLLLRKRIKLSANTIRKAKKLVEAGGVVKVEEDIYQVKSSSDPSKSYMVTKDSCDCLGFKNFYKFHHGKGLKANCSHLEAVRIFIKEK